MDKQLQQEISNLYQVFVKYTVNKLQTINEGQLLQYEENIKELQNYYDNICDINTQKVKNIQINESTIYYLQQTNKTHLFEAISGSNNKQQLTQIITLFLQIIDQVYQGKEDFLTVMYLITYQFEISGEGQAIERTIQAIANSMNKVMNLDRTSCIVAIGALFMINTQFTLLSKDKHKKLTSFVSRDDFVELVQSANKMDIKTFNKEYLYKIYDSIQKQQFKSIVENNNIQQLYLDLYRQKTLQDLCLSYQKFCQQQQKQTNTTTDIYYRLINYKIEQMQFRQISFNPILIYPTLIGTMLNQLQQLTSINQINQVMKLLIDLTNIQINDCNSFGKNLKEYIRYTEIIVQAMIINILNSNIDYQILQEQSISEIIQCLENKKQQLLYNQIIQNLQNMFNNLSDDQISSCILQQILFNLSINIQLEQIKGNQTSLQIIQELNIKKEIQIMLIQQIKNVKQSIEQKYLLILDFSSIQNMIFQITNLKNVQVENKFTQITQKYDISKEAQYLYICGIYMLTDVIFSKLDSNCLIPEIDLIKYFTNINQFQGEDAILQQLDKYQYYQRLQSYQLIFILNNLQTLHQCMTNQEFNQLIQYLNNSKISINRFILDKVLQNWAQFSQMIQKSAVSVDSIYYFMITQLQKQDPQKMLQILQQLYLLLCGNKLRLDLLKTSLQSFYDSLKYNRLVESEPIKINNGTVIKQNQIQFMQGFISDKIDMIIKNKQESDISIRISQDLDIKLSDILIMILQKGFNIQNNMIQGYIVQQYDIK